ncbi:MAG: hypothetical protein WBV31_20315 [Terriglobales bacterium]|jgi:hypothetical protein
MGENFCQPPLLPLSRADVEPELPGLGTEPQFELPRASAALSEFELAEFWRPELWFERSKPLFELPFPGRTAWRLLPLKLPVCCRVFETPDCPRSIVREAVAAVPRAEKKCWFCDTFRVVEAAAARPLAE